MIYPKYPLKTRKNNENKTEVWDIVRKKWVILTPEELVRQHFVHYLINQKKYPKEVIIIEKEIEVHQTKKRFDVAVINKHQEYVLLAECKAPTVALTSAVLEQILKYNLSIQAKCLVITNGITEYVFTKNENEWVAGKLNEWIK